MEIATTMPRDTVSARTRPCIGANSTTAIRAAQISRMMNRSSPSIGAVSPASPPPTSQPT